MTNPPVNWHATAILIGNHGVLLRGPARSGKSALAISCLRRAECHGLPAALVADDQVLAEAVEGRIVLHAPESTLGLIEISGAGLLRQPFARRARLDLVVDLAPADAAPRLPECAGVELLGCRVRRVALPCRQAAFGADAVVSIVLAGIAFAVPDAADDG